MYHFLLYANVLAAVFNTSLAAFNIYSADYSALPISIICGLFNWGVVYMIIKTK